MGCSCVKKKWSVKDVLSHLVGWEREVAQELLKVFKSEDEPWFMQTASYNKFNERIHQEFKNYSAEALLSELKKWQKELKKNIQEIGEERIRQRSRMVWVFDEGELSHFKHHLQQVGKAIKNVK